MTLKLFLDITTPSFRYTLKGLVGAVKHMQIYAYSIKGAPVTLGVPDNLFMNIDFPNLPVKWERSDNKAMAALAIEGAFTHHDMTEPVVIVNGDYRGMQQIDINLTNPDGSAASFTEVALWIDLELEQF